MWYTIATGRVQTGALWKKHFAEWQATFWPKQGLHFTLLNRICDVSVRKRLILALPSGTRQLSFSVALFWGERVIPKHTQAHSHHGPEALRAHHAESQKELSTFVIWRELDLLRVQLLCQYLVPVSIHFCCNGESSTHVPTFLILLNLFLSRDWIF